MGTVNEATDPDTTSTTRHIRGWWPYSEATFPVSGGIDVNPDSDAPGTLWCPIHEVVNSQGTQITPPELAATVFGHQTNDTWGWPLPGVPEGAAPRGGNVGLYGAVVKYVFNLANSDTENLHAAYMKLYARNNDGSVFGAAKIVSPSGYSNWIVPALGYSGSAEGIKLTENSNGANPVLVAPGAEQQTTTVSFTAGGASSLPANLLVEAIRTTVP